MLEIDEPDLRTESIKPMLKIDELPRAETGPKA